MEKEEKIRVEKIGQDQFHAFIYNDNTSWQEIIYDLINSEQLDPWDIDLSILSQGYLERVRELEEANFSLSSKILLVASLMLRIKSELLMNKYIKSLDDILFGKKEEIQQTLNLRDIDDDDIPELIPKTPLPRFKKISLQELIAALDKAVVTEQRRVVRREVEKEALERTKFFIPKKTISLADSIKKIHQKIKDVFTKSDKVAFSKFSGPKKQEQIDTFIPLLHLDNHNHLYMNQQDHFGEIWIHKDGNQFIVKDEIITSSIEEEFEEELKEMEEEL